MKPGMRMYMMTREREEAPKQHPHEQEAEHQERRSEPGRREYRNTRSNLAVYNNYQGDTESRYRGKDGRWHSGTRRSEYDGADRDDHPIERHMDDDEREREYGVTIRPRNVIEWPYAPREPWDPPESRMIGFGARDNLGEHRDRDPMEHGEYRMDELARMPVFDRETAEEWVRGMHNEDKNHPHGGKWTADALKPMAQKYNIPTDGKRFWEFYAMTNAMYSDYSEIARKFGITSPEFYVCMAKAFMDDKDAVDDKVAMYYEYIAKK